MTSRSPDLWANEALAPVARSGRRARAVAVFLGAIFALTAAKGAALSLSASVPTSGAAGVAMASEPVRRADIVDRNGELLATTVDVYSLFADPRAIWDPADTARQLATVLDDIDEQTLAERLANRDRAFVWVKRQLTPRQRQAVFALGLEGLGFRRETRRAYPSGTLAGHAIGYTGIDGNGLGGTEFAEDARLSGGGDPLRLTIDAGVQFILEGELARAAEAQKAIGGAGIIVEAATGEIRAVASWPPINPNRARDVPQGDPSRFNRAMTGVYELGSVFKPLTIAAALDAGAIGRDEAFDVSGTVEIAGRTITDLHPIDSPATVTTIVSESSNIGTIRIAQRLGRDRQWAAIERFGLMERPLDAGTGASAPILPDRWDALSAATTSYGHGIAVSPLALVMAYAALANDGDYVPARLFAPEADERPVPARRAVSAETAAATIGMLRETVVAGTGRAADAPGFRVAGKTGTAEKAIDGAYDPDRNLNSFAAIFPADRPEYAILIVLDEAKPPRGPEGLIVGDTAATTAAPLAGRVIERAAPLLGVLPRWDNPADRAANTRRQSG